MEPYTFLIRFFVGIIINIASSWNRGGRMRNAVAIWMRSACMNSVLVGTSISGRKGEIARVEIGPVLPVIS